MKNLKKGVLMVLLTATMVSCSKDEIATLITTENLTKSIDENAAEGTVLGTVSGLSNTGTVTFSIANQSPNGALAIDATTGELTIADAAAFDYESNPVISATIDVADGAIIGSAIVTINLNDIDDIEFLLSTSKTAYANAAASDWVIITEAEYDNLAVKLNNVNVTGASEAEFDSSVQTEVGAGGVFTVATINTANTVPSGSYIFAFKYETESHNNTGHSKNTSVTSEAQVKQSSTSNHSGFVNLGNTLPTSIKNNGGTFYFVLKGNANATTANGYMAFTKASNVRATYKRIPETSYHHASGNENNLGDATFNGGGTGVKWLHQGLTTTQKQW